MTTTRHTDCTHPATKAARAACRRTTILETIAGDQVEASTPRTNVAYTHPTPRHVRGIRHETVVHALANRMGDTVQFACGRITQLHEAPHTPDGVRLTDAAVTCPRCMN